MNQIQRPDTKIMLRERINELENKNLELSQQLSHARQRQVEPVKQEMIECDICQIENDTYHAEQWLKDAENKLVDDLCNDAHLRCKFQSAGLNDVWCLLQCIMAATRCLGEQRLTELCHRAAYCKAQGQDEIREQAIEDLLTLTDGVELDPTCKKLINEVLAFC